MLHGLWFPPLYCIYKSCAVCGSLPFTNTACPCTNSAQFVVPSLWQILLPFTKTAWFCWSLVRNPVYKFCTVCSSLPFTNSLQFVIPHIHPLYYGLSFPPFTNHIQFVIPRLQMLCGLWFPPLYCIYKSCAVCGSLPFTILSSVLWFVFPSFYKSYSVCNSSFTNAVQFVIPFILHLQILQYFTVPHVFCADLHGLHRVRVESAQSAQSLCSPCGIYGLCVDKFSF